MKWLRVASWRRPLNPRHIMVGGLIGLVIVSGLLSFGRAEAARFTNRSLAIMSPIISDQTTYTIKFGFPSSSSIGSIKMEFCDDPVPYLPCYAVPGLSAAEATLASQSGEDGFNISAQTATSLVLSRSPRVTGQQENTYVLKNMINPSTAATFYIRLTSYSSTNATGEYIDYGGVVSATNLGVTINTQVPPSLTFCVSLILSQYNCTSASIEGGNYVDFGSLRTDQTYATQSQLIAHSNATDGYSVSVYGIGLTAGNKVVPSLELPTMSAVGNSQFGINLVANDSPLIGSNQDGPGVDAAINPDYAQPNYFVYRPGDTLINMPGITDFKRFTVSYMFNMSPDQPPGRYGTTLTYICVAYF